MKIFNYGGREMSRKELEAMSASLHGQAEVKAELAFATANPRLRAQYDAQGLARLTEAQSIDLLLLK